MKLVKSGFVLEARSSAEASRLSYDDMSEVGQIRLHSKATTKNGDDLNDAPYACNGSIYDGELIALKKGDYVVILRR